MNFFKRAFLAVTRRKGKSAILFVIFILIANMVLAGLAIQHATDYASVLARQQLGGTLTFQYNMQAAMQAARSSGQQRPQIQSEPITEDMVKTILQQKDIVDYNYLVSTNGLAENFDPVVTDDTSTTTQSSNSNTSGDNSSGSGGFMGGQANFTMPDVTVEGVSYTSLLDDFKQGTAKITAGKDLTANDEGTNSAVIEKNLADQNNLQVGDTITIKGTRSDNTISLKIVGIYETTATSEQGSGMRNLSFSSPYNRIYVDYKAALPLKATSATTSSSSTSGSSSSTTASSSDSTEAVGADSVVFYLDDPQNIDKAVSEIKAMTGIDWTKFNIDANDTAYKEMVGPIENVASFSMTVVYIVAIAGAVILALILTLSIRERMYETGVLLSMGEGKFKVIGQYLAEVLLIAIVAFAISTFSGKFIAQKVGDTLLSREIATTQQQQSEGFNFPTQGNSGGNSGQRYSTNGRFNRGFGNSTEYKPISSVDIQITPGEIGGMAGIGLGVIVLGILLPASTVMRYKPKTILTKTM